MFCSKASSRNLVSPTLSVQSYTHTTSVLSVLSFICYMSFNSMILSFPLFLFPSIRPSITSYTRLSPLKMCPSNRLFLSNTAFRAFFSILLCLTHFRLSCDLSSYILHSWLYYPYFIDIALIFLQHQNNSLNEIEVMIIASNT